MSLLLRLILGHIHNLSKDYLLALHGCPMVECTFYFEIADLVNTAEISSAALWHCHSTAHPRNGIAKTCRLNSRLSRVSSTASYLHMIPHGPKLQQTSGLIGRIWADHIMYALPTAPACCLVIRLAQELSRVSKLLTTINAGRSRESLYVWKTALASLAGKVCTIYILPLTVRLSL